MSKQPLPDFAEIEKELKSDHVTLDRLWREFASSTPWPIDPRCARSRVPASKPKRSWRPPRWRRRARWRGSCCVSRECGIPAPSQRGPRPPVTQHLRPTESRAHPHQHRMKRLGPQLVQLTAQQSEAGRATRSHPARRSTWWSHSTRGSRIPTPAGATTTATRPARESANRRPVAPASAARPPRSRPPATAVRSSSPARRAAR